MISMQVYPVLNGVEVWVAASCMSKLESHTEHVGDSVAFFVSEEEIDTLGVHLAVMRAMEMVLSEQPGVTERYRC